ncbi:MAG TPA: hypothetical protein PLF26_04935 [Blastocatellia bacterium]|nr:hypothetical protein [Blastocatellia bacterium]
MNLRSMYAFCLAGAIASTAQGVLAQGPKIMTPAEGMVWVQDGGADSAGKSHATFIATEMAFDGKTVKGAPYSAESVTESVQTLADGNRITSSTHSVVYRDSEGRTRREQTVGGIGPWAASGSADKIVIINDPVAGVHFIMNPDDKTATSMPTPRMIYSRETKGDKDVVVVTASSGSTVSTVDVKGPRVESRKVVVGPDGDAEVFELPAPPPGAPGAPAIGPMQTMRLEVADSKDAKKESLGKRNIEGVECEGTRSTITIAAGEIGNERAIEVVTEQWYSPELQTVVMRKHTDPRFGETTFRLTNVKREEPDKSLFEVPADFKVDNGGPVRLRMKQKSE